MFVRSPHIALFFFILLSAYTAGAQDTVADRIVPDTAVVQSQYERSNRFYERLKERSANSRLARKLYAMLVSEDSRHADTLRLTLTLDKEIDAFQPWEGRRIRSITILRDNIFKDIYPRRNFRTFANSFHVVTREREIRRNLLFREGDRLSALLFARNEQLLRSLNYLADADIVALPAGKDEVDIRVITRDVWSIELTLRSVPRGHRYIDLYDHNFLGSGNRLDIGTYIGFKGDKYGGNRLEFHAPNFLGTFYKVDMLVGKGYAEHDLGMMFGKEFILPNDYLAGGIVEDRARYEPQFERDTMLLVRARRFEGWIGRSWAFPLVKGSFYLSGHYGHVDFPERPEVLPDSNTRYHAHRTLLFNAGIYRETYYRGNMIYGYGREENIPYGHKFEVTAGRYRGEFAEQWYVAAAAAAGRQTRLGYFRLAAGYGTFLTDAGEPVQGALKFDFDGFSNLWDTRRNFFRQFVSIHYLSGIHRLRGEGERLIFRNDASLSGMRRDGHMGSVRLVANTETVMFTPLYFYGFRFVFFGYADLGWLGDDRNPLRNDFYTAVGVGVRFKNERMNFSTLQVRLGLMVKDGDWARYRHVRFSGQQQFTVPEFKGGQPNLPRFM